jgi:hypothetical protein
MGSSTGNSFEVGEIDIGSSDIGGLVNISDGAIVGSSVGASVALEGDSVALEGDSVALEGDSVALEGDSVALEGDSVE